MKLNLPHLQLNSENSSFKAFQWQSGYSAFSVSDQRIEAVYHYILNQAEHHKTHTYKDELLKFLQDNHICFDEQYLWDE